MPLLEEFLKDAMYMYRYIYELSQWKPRTAYYSIRYQWTTLIQVQSEIQEKVNNAFQLTVNERPLVSIGSSSATIATNSADTA